MNPKVWFYSEKLIIATQFEQITAFQEPQNSPKCYMTQIRIFTHYVCVV